MTFQRAKPELHAKAHASASSSAAQRFYTEDQAAIYTSPANATIQRDLTLYALELVQCQSPPPSATAAATAPFVLLDLGAGSGLSTQAAARWLHDHHIDGFSIAFDISASMLSLRAGNTTTTRNDQATSCSSSGNEDRTAFYCGNAAQKFPLRAQLCDAAIGISMLQWLTNDGLRTCYKSLHRVLQDGSAAVFQIYPESQEQVAAMEQIALQVGFGYAEVFVSYPHMNNTAKKWFVALQKNPDPSSGGSVEDLLQKRDQQLCQYGRRYQRRCAWHLLKRHASPSAACLRDRLGRQHVKAAWHVWRKYHRSLLVAKQAQDETSNPLHHKAKRSLEIWKSDEFLGEALRKRFLQADGGSEGQKKDEERETQQVTTTTTITYNLLLAHLEEVVDIMHTVRLLCIYVEDMHYVADLG